MGMDSTNQNAEAAILRNTFECIFGDFGGLPSIFSAGSLNEDNKTAVLSLIH